jgi:HEAT repeat protein
MKMFSKLFSRRTLLLLAFALSLSSFAGAADLFDNSKLIKMVREGVSCKVVFQLIDASPCHFDSSAEALIEVQKAGKEGGWSADDVGKLQEKVIAVADQDKKRLKELVEKAVIVFENAAVGDEEYERIMRELMFEGKTTVGYLLKHLQEESERKRIGVVDALLRLGDKSDEVCKLVFVMLTDRSKPVREMAAKTVAGLATPQTCDALIEQLNTRNPVCLDGVALALGYLGEAKGVEPLTRLLKNSSDDETRISAAWALGRLRAKSPAALSALLEAVLDERNPELRVTAAEALGLCGERKAVSHIKKAFLRFRPGREELIKQLAFFKDGEGVDFLLELVEDDNPQVKKAAKETMAALSGENYDSGEEYKAWWEANKDRLNWPRENPSGPKIPEPRGGGQ